MKRTRASKMTIKHLRGIIPVVLAVLAFSLLTSACSQATKPVTINTGTAVRSTPGTTLLWEVKSPAGSSYLFGSIHALKKDMYPLNPLIEKAFAETGMLVVEADISGEKMLEAATATMKKAIYQGEETLKDHVSAETYEKTAKKLESLGMNIESLQKFKPWFLALTIAGIEIMKMGFNPNLGIDKYFLDKAAGDKKEIRELEGIDFQANFLDSFSPEENESFLISSLKTIEENKETLEGMIKAWSSGDVPLMEKLVFESTDDSPEAQSVNKKMLEVRNLPMAEKILSYLKEPKTFMVIVGAAHLVGPKGLIRLLQEKGYQIRQL